MMSTNEISSSLCKKYESTLNEMMEAVEAEIVYLDFRARYESLFKVRTTYENKALNKHLTQNILPGIALYDALLSCGRSQTEAITMFERFNRIFYSKLTSAYRLLGKLPMFYSLLRILTKKSMSVTYPCAGWTTTWLENSASEIAFDVSCCFYQNVLRSYQREELLKCFCQIDDEVYGNMSRNVIWARTKTLGRGDQVCDFRFIREKSK